MVKTDAQTMKELKVQLIKNIAQEPLIKQFHMRLAKPNTWIIEYFNPSGETPRAHLLIGSKYALLIDPTDCPYDIRAYIETYITDKPILVANSHSHGDHTGANWRFDDCTIYMSERCQEEMKKFKDRGVRPDLLGNTNVSQNEGTVIRHGDVIDLGDRIVRAIEIENCHSPTSILLLDETAGILFTGDEIDAGQVNMWTQPVEVFRDNMVYLNTLRDKFDMICCPHNGTPMHADTLNYFIENCERVMSGIEGELDVASTSYLLNPFETRSPESVEYRRWDPVTRRSEWMGTAINYNVDLIFRSDLDKPHRVALTGPNSKPV